ISYMHLHQRIDNKILWKYLILFFIKESLLNCCSSYYSPLFITYRLFIAFGTFTCIYKPRYVLYPYPFPTLWNIKRLFIISNFWKRLFLFDLLFFNQPMFFLLNLFKKFLRCSFFGALFHQLSLNSILQK